MTLLELYLVWVETYTTLTSNLFKNKILTLSDVFIRGVYLIPVPSCSLTSGEVSLTSGAYSLTNGNSLTSGQPEVTSPSYSSSLLSSEGQRNLLAPIIGGVVAGIALVAVAVIVVLVVRRKSKQEKGKELELDLLPDSISKYFILCLLHKLLLEWKVLKEAFECIIQRILILKT